MEPLFSPISNEYVSYLETLVNDYFFLIALVFLAFELIRYAVKRQFSWTLLGDTITNYLTLVMFILTAGIVVGLFYVSTFFYVYQFAIFDIQTTWVTVVICVILADITYYWEHRFMHRVNFAWATHTVHHSSPFFNISVAYRFGPMDGIWPLLFHLPLALLGFHPFVIFFAEIFVQVYQTALHTEVIRKLPRPIEAIMNTPSHHRVHHASNRRYLDKNYAGIFIIWDRMFGTFAREEEKVVYGLTQPINSVNPFVAFFHGFYRLARDVWNMPGFFNKIGVLIRPPGWSPKSKAKKSAK